jgi:hypothetical protein
MSTEVSTETKTGSEARIESIDSASNGAIQTAQVGSDPTGLLRDNVDVLAPFLAELFNCSLLQGVVPIVFKSLYITPLLKKSDLDPTENKSYWPISNLSV